MIRENTGKGKAPYIPLYADDFLSDSTVEEMDCSECGIYIRLLLTAWHNANKNETPPTLLLDISYLAGAGRTTTNGITIFFRRYPMLWRVTSDGKRIYQKREVQEFARVIRQAIRKQELALAGVKGHGRNTDDIQTTLARLQITLGKCEEILNAIPGILPQVVPQVVPVHSTEYIEHSTDIKKEDTKKVEVVKGGAGEKTETPPATANQEWEQLTLQGKATTTARPFGAKDFLQLWNKWVTANRLEVEQLRIMTDDRRRKFEARQKTFAKYGANGREFWARLLSVVMEYNGGFYIGNSNPQQGHAKPWAISFDWLFKNDTHIAKLLELQTGGGEEWTKTKEIL